MARRPVEIADVPPERRAEAVGVLSRAFAGDPLLRHICHADKGDYPRRLRAFFEYVCEVQAQMGWPLLGAVPRTRLAGVAAVALPEQPEWPDALSEHYNRLAAALGTVALARIEAYATQTGASFPAQPLCYVKAIGVRPQLQGRGYARRLLDAVHALSERHPTSTGVALDTENPENVPLYEGMGYRVIAEVPLGALRVWCMFRPNEAERERAA